MEYWTDLYKEIAARITDNLPEIAWVDLWHEQVNYLTEELPFPVPAVFLAFDTIQTDDRGKLIQDCNTQIDMYLFYEILFRHLYRKPEPEQRPRIPQPAYPPARPFPR